jgi:hypothetical protein
MQVNFGKNGHLFAAKSKKQSFQKFLEFMPFSIYRPALLLLLLGK